MSTMFKERKAEEVASSALSAPAERLPYFDQIQKSFGRHSIANVRARIGANEATEHLGARGFAYGEDVVLESPDLHTAAHEAAHVIQQRGRANLSGLGRAGDEHEQHAEQVATLVERGESAEALLDQYAPGSEVTAPSAVQLFAGERPLNDYGAITKHPDWMDRAQGYEKRLGQHAYNHGRCTAVLDAALTKMQTVLMEYYQVAAHDRDAKRALYREAFCKDDPSSAGQIGNDRRLDTITQMLGTGNLRERMTAFYNAAYYNTAGGHADARGFKQIVHAIIYGGDEHSAHDRALEEQQLNDLKAFNKGWWRTGARMLTAGIDLFKDKPVSYNFASDPFALGNLALAHEVYGAGEIGLSQNGRTERTAPEKAARGKSSTQYNAEGMPLSARELSYLQRKSPAVNAAPANATLPWVPGEAYWQMPDHSRWVDNVRDKLHMPVTAGVSGTTTRMLSAFQWLNTGGDAMNFRLALIGWMLPVNDHSLYEILRGAQLAGLFNPDEGNLTDVVRMYMNVAPLPTSELRANAGHNGLFPHEQIYMEKAAAGKDTDAGFLGADATHHRAAVAADPGIGPSFTTAHATAIYAYTSGLHMVMNAVLETKNMPTFAAHRMIKSKLMAVVDHYGRMLYLQNKQAAGLTSPVEDQELIKLTGINVESIDVIDSQLGTWLTELSDHTKTPQQLAAYRSATIEPWIDVRMPRIYDELLAHTNMTVEGLKQLPAVPPQIVWRGDWQNAVWGYGVGSRIPINVLRSFSTDRGTAEGFMSDGNFSTKVLLCVQTKLNGAGRDIKKLSSIPGEDEVLFPPGTSLVVTRIEKHDTYTLLHCDEQ